MADENDILDGAYLEEEAGVFNIVVLWRHPNVTGATVEAKLINAHARTPPRGTYLPGTTLVLKKKRVEPESADVCRTTLTYGLPGGAGAVPENVGDPPIIEVFGNLESGVTNVDKDGTLIVIDPPDGQPGDPITPEVAIQLPRYGLRITTRENGPPDQKAKTYVGRVNSGTYRGSPARSWLCGPIRGRSDDGGATYVVTYDLFYDELLWTAKLRWQDDKGQLFDPVVEKFTLPEADLNGLGV